VNAERWRGIERIFHAALERQSHERDAFVEHECGGGGLPRCRKSGAEAANDDDRGRHDHAHDVNMSGGENQSAECARRPVCAGPRSAKRSCEVKKVEAHGEIVLPAQG
jgi:hypothetical protein